MDFEYHYSEEQERFRREAGAWLEANPPPEVSRSTELDQTAWERCITFRRKLGEKGWLAPTSTTGWDGAGLTLEHHIVLRQELRKRGVWWLLEDEASPLVSALQGRGTEEQQERYLPTISQGEATLWHLSLEPGMELDPGSLGIQAFRDGDDYILRGEETFTGQGPWPDLLWTLALTDPQAPPELSTATFLVPGGLEGIHIRTPATLVPGETHRITFDNVWVPSYCLLGDEGEGWAMVQETLLAQPLAEYPPSEDEDVADLIQYACETVLDGSTLSKKAYLRQLLMEVYINSQVVRILRARNVWMAETGQKLTYQAAEVALLEKRAALRLSQVVREIMGVFALLDEQDPRSPFRGRFERQQRHSIARQNPTGGPEVQAGAVARHLGLGQGRAQRVGEPSGDTTSSISRAR